MEVVALALSLSNNAKKSVPENVCVLIPSALPALVDVPALPALTAVPADPALVAVPAVPAEVAVVAFPEKVVAVTVLPNADTPERT